MSAQHNVLLYRLKYLFSYASKLFFAAHLARDELSIREMGLHKIANKEIGHF